MRAFAPAVFLLGALSARAAIDGTVVNGTTGKPQGGVSVTLVKPGQGGMQTLGTTTSDANGHFAFAKDQPGGGPQLLQAVYGGVNYNKLMTPNIPTSNVELNVYEATKSADSIHVAQHMMLVEPSANGIAVSENLVLQNDLKTTYSNAAMGGIRFFLPPGAAADSVRVQVQGPQGMPLPRSADKTETNGIYKVDYPIKPGETQFEVDYALAAGTGLKGQVVAIKGMKADTPMRLIAPAGVTLSGTDLQNVGTEPKTQATIYNVTSASGAFSVAIQGAGSLRTPEATQQEEDSPPVTEGRPRIYTYLWWLLSISLAILAVGLVYLYRTSPVREPQGR